MTSTDPGSLTHLLQAHRSGDDAAFSELVSRMYAELQRMARSQLRRARRGQTLDTVGLVHDAWSRLVDSEEIEWQDRDHFQAVMARAMRFVVVDRARRRGAQKRGDGVLPTTFDPELSGREDPVEEVLAVHRAIEQLESFNPRLARITELRFFIGLTDAEIGRALGVSDRTVQRDWVRARAWLERALAEDPHPGPAESRDAV